MYNEKPTELSLNLLRVAKLRRLLQGIRPCTQNCTRANCITPFLSGWSCDACALNLIDLLKQKNHSYFEMYFGCIIYNEARSLFCVSFDEGLRGGEISSFKYQLYPSFSYSRRKNCISYLKKAVEMQRNACACQKQTQKYQLELRMLI